MDEPVFKQARLEWPTHSINSVDAPLVRILQRPKFSPSLPSLGFVLALRLSCALGASSA